MDKQHILNEIRRSAKVGKPLGIQAFVTATGIREHDWRGKYWARWGDALIEAGYSPNDWVAPHEESHIFQSLLELTRKLKKYPTGAEIGLERRANKNFPSARAIQTYSNKAELINKLLVYCNSHEEYEDVERILTATPIPPEPKEQHEPEDGSKIQLGYVYLIRSSGKYKIGYSKAALSRASVVSNLSPEGGEIIHLIRTDDMRGIEAYWHNRFSEKRGNGEWFSLSASDIAAFRRRKFM